MLLGCCEPLAESVNPTAVRVTSRVAPSPKQLRQAKAVFSYTCLSGCPTLYKCFFSLKRKHVCLSRTNVAVRMNDAHAKCQ